MKFDGKAFGEEIVALTRSFVERSLAPLVQRLSTVEKELAEARAALAAQPDVNAIVVGEIAKALADQPKSQPIDLSAIERKIDDQHAELSRRLDEMPEAATVDGLASVADAVEQVREAVQGLPGLDGLVALVEKTVAAVPAIAPGTIRALVDEEVARRVAELPPAVPGKSVTVDDVQPMIETGIAKAVAALPPAITLEDLRPVVDAAAKAAVAELPPRPTAAEVAALIPAPKNGTCVTADDVLPMLEDLVAGAFATIAPPENGKDADPEITRALVVDEVRKVVANLPPAPTAEEIAALLPKVPTAEEVAAAMPEPPAGKDADPDVTAALVKDEVAKAVAALPPALPGKDADPEIIREMVREEVAQLPPAEPGKDATPDQIAAEVEKVLATWERPKDGVSVTVEQLLPAIESTIDKAMAARPLPEDGKQGRGVAALLKDHEGYLIATYTDGATARIARVDGENGKDGLGFDDLEVVDEGVAFVLRFAKGDQVKEFRLAKPTLADSYRGVWRDGAHKAGDTVTYGGSFWIALRDTKERPENGDDWRLAVKKGRDGKDVEAPKTPRPVKLK
jgi:hypothetical protein